MGKLVAGGVLGLGLIYLAWRWRRSAQATAIENAGRAAQQQVEAEARAAEKAIRDAAKSEHNRAGPVAPNDWKFALCIAALGLLVLVTGCGDMKAYGVSRWPMIETPPELEYSASEQAALAEFSAKNPDLARKIVNQARALRAAVDEYNKRAREVNEKQLKALGYDKAEIGRLLGDGGKPDAGRETAPD